MSEGMEKKPGRKTTLKVVKKTQRNLLDRFVEKVRLGFLFFQSRDLESQKQLLGRIYDLQKTSQEVVEQLKIAKEDFKKGLDEELYSYVLEIIDPLLLEINKLSTNAKDGSTVAKHAQIYKRYSEWIEKAKNWVQICALANEREVIAKAVKKYVTQQTFQLVERDMQVIQDYLDHKIDSLIIGDKEKGEIALQISEKLQSHLLSLSQLKEIPEDITFSKINEWKERIGKRREAYFDGALHLIDKTLQNFQSIEEQTAEEMIDVLSQLVFLEEELVFFQADINHTDLSDHLQVQLLQSKILFLEEELHALNANILITEELSDRVQALLHLVEKVKEKIIE